MLEVDPTIKGPKIGDRLLGMIGVNEGAPICPERHVINLAFRF